jgi:phosphatidylglycerophosphate synthase
MTTDTDTAAADRRPLKSRQRRVFQLLAEWLVKRGVAPNAISVFGMIAGMVTALTLFETSRVSGVAGRMLWLASAALIQLRLLCNMLDGMVAVGSGKQSKVGELYNELPDRVSDSFTLVALGYAAGGLPVLGWLAALVAMATAYVRAVGKAGGAGSDFGGPMAKPHRMFVCTCLCLAMTATPVLANHRAAMWTLALITVGALLTLVLRTWRIAGRLRAL